MRVQVLRPVVKRVSRLVTDHRLICTHSAVLGYSHDADSLVCADEPAHFQMQSLIADDQDDID